MNTVPSFSVLTRLSKSLLFFLTFVLCFTFVSAQDDDVIEIDTKLVDVSVSVHDRKGRNVTGLRKSNFKVFDNGQSREIALFADEEAPVSYGVVYDLHSNGSDQLKDVLSSLNRFKAGLRDADDFFIVVFNERGSLSLDFVPSEDQVNRHLSLAGREGPRSLYDAIFLAAGKIEERRTSKKALIVISDGEDRDSHHSYSELKDSLKGLNVQVFVVFAGDTEKMRYSDLTLERRPRSLDKDLTLDRAALDELARKSGGRSTDPEKLSGYGLALIYERIAVEMQTRYSLAFDPGQSDGKWHEIKVEIQGVGIKSLKTDYRGGYQSPEVR